ncbi:anti-sigma factor antagonist [Brevibacillus sp. GCM10020057]|uniref:anti-sigma factor antagonist n=1 Tax=Brevibacillus sp. GCM10020057 TaxID=3317327 RepID=UPI0036292D0B
MDLTIETISSETEHQVNLFGDVDAFTGPKVKEAIMALVESPDAASIVVDLANVEYMDSTGIGIFIAVMKACKQTGRVLAVQNLSSRVERLFRITGLYELISIRKGASE